MAKNSQTRLKETITTVRTAKTNSFGGDRTPIVQALNHWKTENPMQAISLSEKMSMNDVPNRPKTEAHRAYRRAIILLKCAIMRPTKTNEWDGEIASTHKQKDEILADLFGYDLEEARDVVGSSPSAVNPMITELESNPLGFLENNVVTIAGKKESSDFPYGVFMTKGGYRIDPFDRVAEHKKIQAINVPATLYASVKDSLGAIHGTRSDDFDDAAVMFTTQFTGCTYCFSINGGSIVAAHIDPGGGIGRSSEYDGVTISKALRENGGFANGNGGEFKAYGRIDANGYGYPKDVDQMTIVAARSHDDIWHVYSQIVLGGKVISAEDIS